METDMYCTYQRSKQPEMRVKDRDRKEKAQGSEQESNIEQRYFALCLICAEIRVEGEIQLPQFSLQGVQATRK